MSCSISWRMSPRVESTAARLPWAAALSGKSLARRQAIVWELRYSCIASLVEPSLRKVLPSRMRATSSVVSVDREPFKVEESFLRDSSPFSRSVFLRFSVPGACSSWVWISSTTVWINNSPSLARLAASASLASASSLASSAVFFAATASFRDLSITTAAAVDPTDTTARRPMTAAARPAVRGLRRHQRHSRSTAEVGRARIGSPARNRRQSSANATASTYRRSGSFWRHFRQMVSTSAGTFETSSEGRTGSSLTTSSVVS